MKTNLRHAGWLSQNLGWCGLLDLLFYWLDVSAGCKTTLFKRSAVNVSDIDECAVSTTNDCDPMTTRCVNLPGTFTCSCLRGFYGPEGNRSCTGLATPVNNGQRALRSLSSITTGVSYNLRKQKHNRTFIIKKPAHKKKVNTKKVITLLCKYTVQRFY